MEYFIKDDYAKLKELYINKIKHLSMWIWKNDLSRDEILQWLDNFEGIVDNDTEHEQINSLYLLKQYMFFSLNEVRELLAALYRIHFYKNCIQQIRKDTGEKDLDKLTRLYKQELKQTRFLGIGNPSESSSLLLYFFRQENKIPKVNFWNFHDVFLFAKTSEVIGLRGNKSIICGEEIIEPINNYVFIDDLTGSGTQATDYFLDDNSIDIVSKINDYNPKANIYYFTLFSTEQAKKKFIERGLNKIIIRSIFELDDSYKVFHNMSRYFPKKPKSATHDTSHINERNYSKDVCEKNFNKLNIYHGYKCGYNNSQLLLSFFYNTPDNTLPTFWVDNQHWNSIFKRYDKIYY